MMVCERLQGSITTMFMGRCKPLTILAEVLLLLCVFLCLCADTFIQKTKKLFQDTRSQRNMAALTADLAEVHTIMSKNIAEVLGQGEKLDSECCWLLQGSGQA